MTIALFIYLSNINTRMKFQGNICFSTYTYRLCRMVNLIRVRRSIQVNWYGWTSTSDNEVRKARNWFRCMIDTQRNIDFSPNSRLYREQYTLDVWFMTHYPIHIAAGRATHCASARVYKETTFPFP